MFKQNSRNLCSILAAMIAVTAACSLPAVGDEGSGSVPINITIREAPVAEVLSILSEASGTNIVVGQGVTGNIESLNLRNVSVEDALRYVAVAAGLHWYKEDAGFIVTTQELSASALTAGERPTAGPAAASVPQPTPAVPAAARRWSGSAAVPSAGSAAPAAPAAVQQAAPVTAPGAGARAGLAAAGGGVQSPVGATVRIAPTAPLTPAVPRSISQPSGGAAPGLTAAGAGHPQAPAAALSSRLSPAPAHSPLGDVRAPASATGPGRGVSPVSPSHGGGVRPAIPSVPAAVGTTTVPPGARSERPSTVEALSAQPEQADSPSEPAVAVQPAARPVGAEAPPAPRVVAEAGPDAHARIGDNSQGLVESVGGIRGVGDGKTVTTMIPMNYANPAEMAMLLGGTVSRSVAGDMSDHKLGRRQRQAAQRQRGSDAFGSLRGSGGADDYWMQMGMGGMGGIGGGLGTGMGGQARSGRQMGGMGGQSGAGMGMRPEGVDTIVAYMPQNALLVSGEPAAIDQLREVLAILDQPVKQVEISTKFVEVDLTDDEAMGIDWLVSNGSLEFFNLGFAPGEAVNNVVRWARGRFEATLSVLKTQNRGRIVNEPHVVTQNNMPAYISFYTTIPYWTSTITYNQFGQREVDYESEELEVQQTLEVTPRINADDTITMFLTPIMEDQGPDVLGPQGERVPIVASQEIETQVTVADGETLALGGMIRKRDTMNIRYTPLLSEIPIIGRLFQGRTRTEQHSELIIFVTPRILREIPAP